MAPSLLPSPLLEGLDAGLLGRLLAPYGAFLARRAAAAGPGSPARLAAALRPDDPELPVALRHVLGALVKLATPEGEAELRALATEAGVTLASRPGRAADAAAEAYLERRPLFRAAYARLASLSMGRFVDYSAVPGRAPRPLSLAGRAALRRGAADLDREGAVGAPVATVADLTEELVVVVDRPAAAGAPWHRGRPLVAVFAKAERTLSVNTPDPEEQERLRALFGRVLYRDEGAFAPRPRFSGAPFVERGAASLQASGVEGLAAVRLRTLAVQTFEASHLALRAEADDLADAIGPRGRLRELLHLGEVVHWSFEFFPVGRPPFVVEIDPPNQWRLPDRRDAALVRRFLARQGFLVAAA
ncbi:MAG TPA: hypothetical protein VFS43_27940 [Polyangiaceae bacterium]|nr:hypothetical protein [Polyangiaceae bacterium]